MESGKYLVSMSMKLSATRLQVKKAAHRVCKLKPQRHAIAAAVTQLSSSTNGYRKDIGPAHARQRPFRKQ